MLVGTHENMYEGENIHMLNNEVVDEKDFERGRDEKPSSPLPTSLRSLLFNVF